jgi:predicted dinucleotide-binding enzyme
MTSITIIGAGNMGSAIAHIAAKAGADIQLLARDLSKAKEAAEAVGAETHGTIGDDPAGDIVVLALPHAAVEDVLAQYAGRLTGKILVDITNPVDFTTFDGLVVPADSSAAALIADKVPDASVVKAFNINFAETLTTGANAGNPTTVVLAGDDGDGKADLRALIEAGGLRAVDAGSLARARDLEALGFLQIALAAADKTTWSTGFTLLP